MTNAVKMIEERITQLEEIILVENGMLAAKECAKGAVVGTVHLMQELIEIKDEIKDLQQRFNKLIYYVKNTVK